MNQKGSSIAGAFAQDGGRDGGRRGGARGGFAGREAGLPLRGADEAFARAVNASPIDEQAIRAASQTFATAQADAAIVQAKLRTQVFALPTPEQQAQVTRLRNERDNRRLDERRGDQRPRQRS